MRLRNRAIAALALALLIAVVVPVSGPAAPSGPPVRVGQLAGPDGPAGGDRPRPQDHGGDLRRAAQPEERPPRPPRRVGPARRPVQARRGPHALRAAGHRGQGGPADRAVRHRGDPLRDGRGAALRQAAGPPHLRHPPPGEVRAAVPHVGDRPRARPDLPEPPPGRARGVGQAAQDDRHRDRQVPVGALHVDGRPRGRPEAGAPRGALPRVRVRHARLRADRGPGQGREPGLPVGRRDRARRQPAPRRAEEDRLHAEEPLLPVPRSRPAGEGAGGEGRALHDGVRGAPAVHGEPGGRGIRHSSSASGRRRPGCPTSSWTSRPPPPTRPGSSWRPR